MALPSPVPQTSAARHKSSPISKRANPAKLKRGGQPRNQNARKLGAFSVYQPGHLRALRFRINTLENSYYMGTLSPNKLFEQTTALHKELASDPSVTAMNLQIKVTCLVSNVTASFIPCKLRQIALEAIACCPFHCFELGYKDFGISRDADSFFPVSKLSARNSPDSPLQFQRNLESRSIPEHSGEKAGAGSGFATNLTDEQWAILAPLIPPDPWEDWLTGLPPVIIAASRVSLTHYYPTGEFNDFVIMQNFPSVGAELAPAPAPVQKRGRPRDDSVSPRALLDAIFWKLATGRTWHELPDNFPPMRLCRKYYRRLFLSGRLYTLLLALYNHMSLEAVVDPYLLLKEGIFTTTPSQNIALSPHAQPTWQNYTALLFMQLAREAYSHLARNRKQANRFYHLFPIFKGEGQLSTGVIPALEPQHPTPTFQPLEQSLIGKKFQKIESEQKTIDRIIAKRTRAQNDANKSGFTPASPPIPNLTDLDAETEQ